MTSPHHISDRLASLPPGRARGFVLVIVLALLVLLTGLVVAFFTRSASELEVSTASVSSDNSRELAMTALDIVIDDFRSEIVEGSSTLGDSERPVYFPKEAEDAVPRRVGTSDDLPNLVKRSAYNTAFDGANGKKPASDVSTETDSLDGRRISKARWNSHRLLETDAGWNTAPTPKSASFSAPDWVYLTSNGTHPTSLTDAHKPRGSDPILGRFAYAIYDEGGLLDINHAGHPETSQKPDIARKGYLAYADLTRIGLAQNEINTIVGWRNALTGDDPTGGRFARMLKTEPSGFRNVAEGDRAFVSRTHLLHFFEGKALPPGPLRFLGTFSRGLNQPAYGADGPAIPGSHAPAPTLGAGATYSLSGYTGNNDAAGAEDKINPLILDVRVLSPFSRFEPLRASGSEATTAEIGDSLISRRFPLDRLAWLTHKGPIAPGGGLRTDIGPVLAALRSAGFSDSFLQLGTGENIRAAFGLAWKNDPAGTGREVWVYEDHFSDDNRIIGRLEDVAALSGANAREANFIELLKAAIHVGSIGKGAASDTKLGRWQHARDIRTDYHILQLAANIIDQYDSDGFPTEIALPTAFTNADLIGLYQRKVRGIENLPYLYRQRTGNIMVRQSVPAVPAAALTDAAYRNPQDLGPNTDPATDPATVVTDPGLGAHMVFHTIWNPHHPDSSRGVMAPSQFRLVNWAGGPDYEAEARPVRNGRVEHSPWGAAGGEPDSFKNRRIFPGTPLTTFAFNSSTSELLFNLPGGGYFAEPTALVFPGVPSGTNLRTGSGNPIRTLAEAVDGALPNAGDPGRSYVGALLATFPLRAVSENAFDSSGNPIDPPRRYLLTSAFVTSRYDSNLSGQANTSTSLLQYYDGSSWVPYDVKTVSSDYNESWFNPAIPPANPLQPGTNGISRLTVWTDPRTPRFGSPWGQGGGFLPLDLSKATMESLRPAVVATTTSPAWHGPGMGIPTAPNRGAQLSALRWIANSPAGSYGPLAYYPQALSENVSTGVNAYEDADGQVRGGMSVFSPSSALVGKPQAAGEYASRPVFLNRPFRSVAELGCVFRDLPWKQIDFYNPNSGDAALLDVFCIKEDATPDAILAGRININTRNPKVLEAVLAGAGKDELRPATTQLDASAAKQVAEALVNWTTGASGSSSGPVRTVAELVNRYNTATSNYASWSGGNIFPGGGSSADNILTRHRETPIRSLADVGEARIWNLFIDIIAQSGLCGPNAVGLDKFSMLGETRIWVHLAIDRATGKVIDRQIEYPDL